MAPNLELHASNAYCRLCGTAYGKQNGYFYKSYGQIYKGSGYMHVCKTCVDNLYEDFLKECEDPKLACHQVCRKFNIYWNEDIYNGVLQGSTKRTIMSGYMTRVNVVKYQGKSYDDFLREVGMLWEIPSQKQSGDELAPLPDGNDVESESDDIEIAEEIKSAWGPGYSNKQYAELEERHKYWIKDLQQRGVDVNDIGVGALLRQIVATEIDINHSRARGSDVDKKVNTFNTLIGSAILKPSQKKSEADMAIDNTPLGVWVLRYENEKPLPKDENESKIKKYIHTWMFGHLAKMVGLKNSYTKLYEEEMERLRVEKPEYADEDDDDLITDAFEEDAFSDG